MLLNPSIFMGVVWISEGDLAIALTDFPGNVKNTTKLRLEGGLTDEDLRTTPKDFKALLDFVNDTSAVPRERIRVCVEFGGLRYPKHSTFSKFCVLLAKHGFGILGMSTDENDIWVHRIPEEARKQLPHLNDQREIWVIPQHSGRAWHEFNADGDATPQDAALAAAEIASRRHLYYFLSSDGVVQSSVDILQVLRAPRLDCKTAVFSSEEAYVLTVDAATRTTDLDDLSLEYITAGKRFNFIGKNHALKFSLLHVCRLYGLRLHCLSMRDGGDSFAALGILATKGSAPRDEELKEEYLIWPTPRTLPSDVEP